MVTFTFSFNGRAFVCLQGFLVTFQPLLRGKAFAQSYHQHTNLSILDSIKSDEVILELSNGQ